VYAKQRFQREIVSHGLFTKLDTNRIKVIDKDVADLESGDLENCTDVIHCAANVKFNSPLQLLMKENVDALKTLYALCQEKRFYHISTCYVHPIAIKGPYDSTKIESGLDVSDFICNYAYTKYLAEQFLYSQKGVIDIIRLSCVGSPVENLAPMRGGAHLAILELLERSKLPDIWIPDDLKFSVVPVDVLCKGIVDKLSIKHEGLTIVQYSAPAESKTYNINVKNILQEKSYSAKIWTGISYKKFLSWMSIFYWIIPSILKRIIDANDVISYVSMNQTFHSDLNLPDLTPKEYAKETLSYVERLVNSNNTVISWGLYIFSYIKSFIVWIFDSWIEED
jgi:nucleoside-diphosphate-sugar epimerase